MQSAAKPDVDKVLAQTTGRKKLDQSGPKKLARSERPQDRGVSSRILVLNLTCVLADSMTAARFPL
ncbi:MAG: hypothetical protein DMG28_11080 [Acidobacteria bacterium]|nr:MAG: hypothetical protein AUG07_01140 [Acidobacteria bacterium 13_1_20CM_2_60_10]PYU32589.1 MAG: hypothetical protein DMG28_11080 [Acidobacteriota bacterium]